MRKINNKNANNKETLKYFARASLSLSRVTFRFRAKSTRTICCIHSLNELMQSDQLVCVCPFSSLIYDSETLRRLILITEMGYYGN